MRGVRWKGVHLSSARNVWKRNGWQGYSGYLTKKYRNVDAISVKMLDLTDELMGIVLGREAHT